MNAAPPVHPLLGPGGVAVAHMGASAGWPAAHLYEAKAKQSKTVQRPMQQRLVTVEGDKHRRVAGRADLPAVKLGARPDGSWPFTVISTTVPHDMSRLLLRYRGSGITRGG